MRWGGDVLSCIFLLKAKVTFTIYPVRELGNLDYVKYSYFYSFGWSYETMDLSSLSGCTEQSFWARLQWQPFLSRYNFYNVMYYVYVLHSKRDENFYSFPNRQSKIRNLYVGQTLISQLDKILQKNQTNTDTNLRMIVICVIENMLMAYWLYSLKSLILLIIGHQEARPEYKDMNLLLFQEEFRTEDDCRQ